jgi:hypothetical protein
MSTLPAVLGLLSLVRLAAHRRLLETPGEVWQEARYRKAVSTFVDAPALVRRELCRRSGLSIMRTT